ncbi:hypothetical protein RCL_jg23302.t2 [Rhizophagus clarus]|uniref:Uncharacterized protein n=1 Tax=Rhizophagus clarus TaxID=94130 RepID=A0A8H3L675_9GLOM|nr:hypothetical protein RCL_jg23302.t2 [Rhizophagus clarus]
MRKDAWLVSPPKPTVPINGGLGVVTKESMHTGQMTFTKEDKMGSVVPLSGETLPVKEIKKGNISNRNDKKEKEN